MANTRKPYVLRASVLAVQAALMGLVTIPVASAADSDEDIRALTHPTNTIELGIGNVNRGSYKFGEYNGLQKKGTFGIGGFDVRGGDDYTTDGTFRWRVNGSDLGLDTRNLEAEVGSQGKYRFKYTYDELLRNYSDDYQTPYSGAGSTTLTLPGYPSAAVRGSATTTAATALANWQNLQSPNAVAGVAGNGPGVLIPRMMHNENIETQRKKHAADFMAVLSPNWQFTASAQHEDKDGTKLTGVAFGGPARGALLPEPIDSSIDQYRATLAYVDGRDSFSVGYYASLYRNHISAWTAANPFNGALLNTTFNDSARMYGAPDNQMHRFSLTGSYGFTPTTRLVMGGYYSRLTQNMSFTGPWPSTWNIPVSSANAKVIDANFNSTLTSRPMKDLSLVATYKYENRDNQSPINSYLYAPGNAAGNPQQISNQPLNRRTQQLNLDADYKLASRQSIKAGYEFQEVERTSDAVDSPFRSEKTKESTLRLEYRNNLSATLNGRIGYAYSQRRGSYVENVLIGPVLPSPLISPDPLLPGFRQFYIANRNRDKIRSSLNYQATDKISVQTGLDYNKDSYENSQYGLKSASSWVFKLDGAYSASEALSFNAYYTYESIKSQVDSLVIGRSTTATIFDPRVSGACTGYNVAAGHLPSDQGTDPCRQWSETQSDRVHTLGIGIKATGLLDGKLEFSGDIAYSRARTPIDVTGGAYFGNGSTAPAPAFNNVWIAAESFPEITSNMIDLRLAGKYSLSKASSIRVNYLYRRLKSSDWQYDAFTNSSLGAVAIQSYVGTGMTASNYTAQVLSATYIYSFQ